MIDCGLQAPDVAASGIGILVHAVGGLSRQDDWPCLRLDHQRLMAGRVAGRRYEHHARKDLCFAVKKALRRSLKVGETRQRVAGLGGCFVFPALNEDGDTGKQRVAAAVVEVKVTVRDCGYVCWTNAEGGKRIDKRTPDRVVDTVDGGILRKARIEKQGAARVEDEIGQDGTRLAGHRGSFRLGEVREMEAFDFDGANAFDIASKHKVRVQE